MLDRSRLQTVIDTLLTHASPNGARSEYRMVGTAAALMYGVSLPAGDVDILLRDRAGVDAFGESLFSFECLTAPQYLEGSEQYFCSFLVSDVEIECSTVEAQIESDTHECIGSGPWLHYEQVSCAGHQVPVVALELRLITEWSRDRPDRYVPIVQFMQSHGCDKELLVRGLNDRGISEAAQLEFLKQIDETL